MGPLKNLGVAHRNPKTTTVFQEFSYSVVFGLLENYVKKLKNRLQILLMYSKYSI